MIPDRLLRCAGACLAGAVMLSTTFVSGCGGDSAADLNRAVVVPEPGTTPSGVGSTASEATTAAEAVASPGTPTADVGGPRAAEGFGTLRGRVLFAGTPPERPVKVPEGQAPKDPQYCAADAPILSNHLIVNPENKGIKNALIYIPKPTAVSPEALNAAREAEVIFDQNQCIFVPHVLPILQGSTVTIKSSDPVTHNVNAKVGSFVLNQSFSPNDSREVSVDFASRSPGPVVCDIHTWMKAYWMILDNPYFAVTDENGEFVLEHVPAGTQEIIVWHEATDYLTNRRGDPVDIEADGEATIEFQMQPDQVKPAE